MLAGVYLEVLADDDVNLPEKLSSKTQIISNF